MLVAAYAVAPSASGATYPCSSSRVSEGSKPPACSSYGPHDEGRAVDWRLNYADPKDREDGERLLRALYAHHDELARRMGVQAILWGCHWWSSERPADHHALLVACRANDWRHTDPGWRHDNHIHFELAKTAAEARRQSVRARAGLRQHAIRGTSSPAQGEHAGAPPPAFRS